ncbi:pyruvate kinase [Paenibacillus sp. Soil522]|uniref:pyruvate kinase n=1 Tax=Paenibacillus sp. Soil522 TaxID=1736388 RepID=UPI0007022275|nr:pyruvate kinase [Paenibacillus sp. Soil522]KRE53619.1 pyruvate kinase [Paenibacillus sp. Soil522]
MSIDVICTIGPASSSPAVVRELFLGGMTVARLNMSHGSHESHREIIRHLREASSEIDMPLRIMSDLQGPKIRLGEVEGDGILLEEGQPFELLVTPVTGNGHRANIDYPDITGDIVSGAFILINDGAVKLAVTEVNSERILTKVIVGGLISSNKSVNFPGTKLNIPALTKKDQEDLAFLLEEGIDLIACSFIRQAAHLDQVRAFCRSLSGTIPKLVAKIETVEGVKNFRDIAALSDGIMIARGDLGVELPFEQIPLIQKALLKECREYGIYVITATQMLQSMIAEPVPTRAEVTDIFQAVQDGTSAVMLSAESSVGKHPVQSVKVLKCVSEYAEEIARKQSYNLKDVYARFPFKEM